MITYDTWDDPPSREWLGGAFKHVLEFSPRNPKPKMFQFDLQHSSSNGLKLNHQLVYILQLP